jgi:hypothetical protein
VHGVVRHSPLLQSRAPLPLCRAQSTEHGAPSHFLLTAYALNIKTTQNLHYVWQPSVIYFGSEVLPALTAKSTVFWRRPCFLLVSCLQNYTASHSRG